ncbi:WD40-repeat-containing domain protein [Syncephalis fuscata]|nr:WD40-repeat-containing domain protein [Syncephalis fuscata]
MHKPASGIDVSTTLDATLKAITNHSGEVMDITCIDTSTFITASSKGVLGVYKTQNTDPSWELTSMATITSLTTSYTQLATQPHVNSVPEIAAAGEDGRLTIIHPESTQVLSTSDAYCMPLTGLTWLSSTQILASTCAGQLLMYDRNDLRKPVSVYSDPDDRTTGINAIAVHPSQINKVAMGDQMGRVAVWDFRSGHLPASEYMQAHTAPVREITFHPRYPDQLLSCSDDGTCCISDWAQPYEDRFIALLRQRPRIRPITHPSNTLPANSMDYTCGTESGRLLLRCDE